MQTQNLFLYCKYLCALLLLTGCISAQQATTSTPDDRLKIVLERLDRTSAKFRSAETDFEWDQYQKVVDETDKQRGKVYFRKVGGDTQMVAEVADPRQPKTVLFTEGKVQLFQPKNNHVDVYSTGKNKEAFESFLVLGFGGSGRDMLKSFDVTYGGTDKIDGSDTDRLELIPKSDKVKGMFNHIELWIDARGISIQQKLISPEGDYRLNKYSNIVLDNKLSDNLFKLKTNSKTQVDIH
jgi:outer membrane lipoprotein-sorting protein